MMLKHFVFAHAWITIFVPFVISSPAAVADDPNLDFSRDIRPILSNACFHCHGPDEAVREADLRLDTQAGLMSALTPGSPETSEMVRRLHSVDDEERMPPPESNKVLTPEQRGLLEQWIAQGASWEQHWSFVRPQLPAVPAVKNEGWCRTDIDRFIVARSQSQDLPLSPPASPAQLLRRLYLDLIGLPPTDEEAAHWLAKIWPDAGSNDTEIACDEVAYQQLVESLLVSPHYGERWARRWLDLARYADTNGYEKDRDRSIWPYRDWVVNAFNRDMPFDQFTIEQLAGDMLPHATQSQLIATGFHRNTMLNEEGGIDPLEFRFHAVTDRMATTGTTWLGLTIGCCQCHTHKYDPISHTEYFQMMALLDNADEPILELPDAELDAQWTKNRAEAQKLIEDLPKHWPPPPSPDSSDATASTGDSGGDSADSQEDIQASSIKPALMKSAFEQWLAGERANRADWTVLRPEELQSTLPILSVEPDQSIFASGDTAKRDEYTLTFAPTAHRIHAIQLEALPDERLPARGPGLTYYEGTLGDFYLTEFEALVNGQAMQLASASDSYSKNRFGSNPATAAMSIDGDIQTGWAVDGRQGQRHVAVFQLVEPIPAGTPLTIHMTFGRHFASSLGRFRLSASPAAHAPLARDFDPPTQELLAAETGQLSEADRKNLLTVFLLQAPELATESNRIRDLLKRPTATSTLVFRERPSGHERVTHRHHRGEYLQPEEIVAGGVPSMLPPLPDGQAANRLSLAKWLISNQNPLTSRVVVNRHWQAFFGTGIVKTVDDFGLQGESPSHPELLDFLATTFVSEGWSIKSLHRRIVSSSVYRQSSRVHPEALVVDPENRNLSFMPRFRLEAEILRDSMLVVSGRLNPQLGGPPVRPPQPEGVTEVAYGRPSWPSSQGEDRFRRSLYTFTKRTAPFAMFATFDAPSGEACVAQRTPSNSPLQALTLLNDVMVMELARAAGKRFQNDIDSDPSATTFALERLFRTALVRTPTPEELAALSDFFHAQRAQFVAHPDAARELLLLDENATRGTSGDAHWAAWTATARAVFGLDEFQTRE